MTATPFSPAAASACSSASSMPPVRRLDTALRHVVGRECVTTKAGGAAQGRPWAPHQGMKRSMFAAGDDRAEAVHRVEHLAVLLVAVEGISCNTSPPLPSPCFGVTSGPLM